MGSWIGGDRDGNPNVVGDTLAHAIGAQATRGIFVLSGAGPSARRGVVAVGAIGHADAGSARAGLGGARRQSASQGRAVSTGARRHLFASGRHRERTGGTGAAARAPGTTCALRDTRRIACRSRRSFAHSLAGHGATLLAAGRLDPLIRAVEVFGFHLAVLDLRQNADVHEAVVGGAARPRWRRGRLRDACPRRTRVALLVRELAGPRLLYSPHLDYSPRTASELGILDVGGGHSPRATAPRRCPTT